MKKIYEKKGISDGQDTSLASRIDQANISPYRNQGSYITKLVSELSRITEFVSAWKKFVIIDGFRS